MIILAQTVEGVEIIENAAREAGWVAALFALIVLAGFTLLGWFVRQLWNDLRDVQVYIRETLTQLVSQSNECIGDVRAEIQAFRDVVRNAPCGDEVRRTLEAIRKDMK